MTLQEMVDSFYSQQDIANALNISKPKAAYMLRKQGIKTKKRSKGNCSYCGTELKGIQKKYCSSKCQGRERYERSIRCWKEGKINPIIGKFGIANWLRRYLFEKYKNKCSECGWGETNKTSGRIPLEVEHIDGNYRNNDEDNLKLLCPNCTH